MFGASGTKYEPVVSRTGLPHKSGAVFGREVAYVTGLYLRQALIFTGIILSIVLALDVLGSMTRVLALNDSASGLNGLLALSWYVVLRAAFIVPSVLPIAAIMGVVWAEFSLARSNERVMIFCSGRAPVRSLMPALIFGVIVGLLQLGAVNFGRPYSTEIQAQSEYRYYGPRFISSATSEPKWFATEDTVFNAGIAFGPPAVLQEVVVYRISPSGGLDSIIRADYATPLIGGNGWDFHNATIWTLPLIQQVGSTELALANEPGPGSRSVSVSLDPLWAEFVDVNPQYLPLDILHHLAGADSGVPDSVAYQSAYQQRYAAPLTCVAMALIGASLALSLFAPQMSPMKMIQVAAIGYATHVVSTVLKLLGEHALIPLPLAIWMWPLSIIIGAFALLYWHDRLVQKTIRARI